MTDAKRHNRRKSRRGIVKKPAAGDSRPGFAGEEHRSELGSPPIEGGEEERERIARENRERRSHPS